MSKKMLLTESNPVLINEWDYEANSNLQPTELYRSSTENVWWKCSKDPRHKWQMKISRRVHNNSGCLYCAGKLVLEEKSLAVLRPDLMEEWDWIENKKFDPKTLSCTSNRKMHWVCKNNPNHKWVATIYNRNHRGTGCIKCSRKNIKPRGAKKLLINEYRHIAKEWDLDKNASIDLNKVTHASALRVWWICSANSLHRWDATVTNRTSHNRGCPYCNSTIASSDNSLKSIFPEVAKEWHYEKNAPLTPENVTRASGKKVWWLCNNDPDHEWEAVIRNRTTLKSKCPECENEIKTIRLHGYMLDNSSSLTKHYKLFIKNLYSIETIVKEADFKRDSHNKTFLRLAYSSIITSLEAYLSDFFRERVMESEEVMIKLFRHALELKNKKISLEDAFHFSDKKHKVAEDYIHEVIWHNLGKVGHLYKLVLSIDFDKTLKEEICRHIDIRHDVVHRNGRSKSGVIQRIDAPKIKACIDTVKTFVEKIELFSN